MKVALVHDYIKEFGGAERVLKVLTEIYPDAPIYTAFHIKNSAAGQEFKECEVHESWLAPLLKIGKLYSPLRFLTPWIWGSMDFSNYDLVITSCSWYVTRGFRVGPKTKVVAYCHTPPRWLYGYETSVGFTRYWPVRVYSAIVGHFMRMYDFKTAQTINHWIANSKEVASRIKKFYRKESVVMYPPVDVDKIQKATKDYKASGKYFLIVSRLVGAKGLEETAKAFKNFKYKLKIVGEAAGFSDVESRLRRLSGGNIELVGRVSDEDLYRLYANAKGFIALARNEDFGMTPVEAQAAGCPVIVFNGGGFKESVVDEKTGILINDTDERTVKEAIKRFNKMKWNRKEIIKHAEKFSKERFVREVTTYLSGIMKHA